MSDTPAMSRPLSGADEFERRLQKVDKQAGPVEDPLAELARLIGQDDPFKNVSPKGAPVPTRDRSEPVLPPAPDPAGRTDPHDSYGAAVDDHGFAAFDDEFPDVLEPAEEHGSSDEPAVVHGPVARPVAQDENWQNFRPASVRHGAAVEPSPDAWAQGGDVAVDDSDVRSPSPETPAASTSRTLVVLAAVVALTGGGLAASFLARPSGIAANASVPPPTILAAAGPTKVQPPASLAGDGGQSEPSTLLDKNKNDGTATAKVVNTVEQPVDLSQAVKPAPGAPDASSPFPEPRKVKTVVVRPDGSIIAGGPDGSVPVSHAVEVTDSNLAFDSRTAIPMPDRSAPPAAVTPDETPAPAPNADVTAKVPLRAATTPRVPPRPAAPEADVTPPVTPARPKLTSTSVQTRPKSKPIEEASLTTEPDSGASVTGGGFAVQLGAPPSAQEAHDVSLRLQKKFADQLGGHRPAVHEAKSGDRSVFRIRVGNLSQADAKDLCAKLQAGGGACFVVRN